MDNNTTHVLCHEWPEGVKAPEPETVVCRFLWVVLSAPAVYRNR